MRRGDQKISEDDVLEGVVYVLSLRQRELSDRDIGLFSSMNSCCRLGLIKWSYDSLLKIVTGNQSIILSYRGASIKEFLKRVGKLETLLFHSVQASNSPQ